MKKYRALISFFLSIILLFSTISCNQKANPNETTKQNETLATEKAEAETTIETTIAYSEEDKKIQEEFDNYLQEFFIETIRQSDTISVHYLMNSPKDFGINDYKITFGSLMIDEKALTKELEAEKATLASFDKQALTKEQQLTLDILSYYLQQSIDMIPYHYYEEPLPTSNGIVSMLPVYFAEYTLNTEQDIKDYLALMDEIKPYFEEILSFEEKRIELGLFMDDQALDSVISQCQKIYAQSLDHFFLNEIFAEQVNNLTFLSKEEKDNYIHMHEAKVLEQFAPAYAYLISELSNKKGLGGKVLGAISYPDGEAYVNALCQKTTSSKRTIEEIKKALEADNTKLFAQIQTLVTLNPSLASEMTDFRQPDTDPEGILKTLLNYYKDLFPGLNDCTYTISYVHKSLEDSVSPAFYMLPPIDDYKSNSIYINNKTIGGNGLFTTLAHEGYPGHMLQNTYFRSVSKYPVRSLFNFLSYSEGWATYVERSSFAAIPGISGQLAKIMAANSAFSLNALALADIGINYEGWDFQRTYAYFNQNFGIDDKEQVRTFYQIFVSSPFSYLPYALGSLELSEIIDEQQDLLEDDFDFYTFHKSFLEIGPAPLFIVKEYLTK